ncbi:hypothetical protein FPV67DRAFT_1677587 [Lyophyllum atratum]|nr:hypothetical protein FPV67DRAFT_1677587 [Lyophyllum atratum]
MRVAGFLITLAEARRWYSQQELGHPDASDENALSLLKRVVRHNHARLLVVRYPTQSEDDNQYLIPTRRAHFSRQRFRDIGWDARRLEQYQRVEKEDTVEKLIKEHGLEAQFATAYVDDSDWYR